MQPAFLQQQHTMHGENTNTINGNMCVKFHIFSLATEIPHSAKILIKQYTSSYNIRVITEEQIPKQLFSEFRPVAGVPNTKQI